MRRFAEIRDTVPAVWTVGYRILNEFEVTGILGQGGMGTVYKVYDYQWKTTLAVKSPRPEIFTRADGKENFVREAETWINLDEHPHIVTCRFVRTLGGIPRLFADYIEGGSLADWIRQGKLYQDGPKHALERILDVAIQFAWGLHSAHGQGLVHQDIKPANVMLTRQGVAKVTDFSLAKARAMAGEEEVGEGKEQQSILVSSRGMTPAYCSPEQFEHQGLTRKTDIWSWGVSVLQMFVGAVTWDVGVSAGEVLTSYQRTSPALPIMPTEVEKLLSWCFQRQPEARPATMKEVTLELQAIYERLVGQAYAREAPAFRKRGGAALYYRGISLQELEHTEEALAVFEQGLRLDPQLAHHAHRGKGAVLRKLGRFEEALAALEQSLRLDPQDATAHHEKSIALAGLGRFEEALVAIEQSIQLDPQNATAHYNRGMTLGKLGRTEEEFAAIEQCIQLDPQDAVAHYYRAGILHDLGRVKEALLAIEQAIRLDPSDAQARHLKWVWLQQLK